MAKCHVVFHNFHYLIDSVKIQLVKEFQILREGFLIEKKNLQQGISDTNPNHNSDSPQNKQMKL